MVKGGTLLGLDHWMASFNCQPSDQWAKRSRLFVIILRVGKDVCWTRMMTMIKAYISTKSHLQIALEVSLVPIRVFMSQVGLKR
jgi:hypothetical protein